MVEGDPSKPGSWQEEVSRHEVVINLAGASIFRRWTNAEKRLIYDSRIETTTNLMNALGQNKGVKPSFISASAVGYYGFHGNEALDELQQPKRIDDHIVIGESDNRGLNRHQPPVVRVCKPGQGFAQVVHLIRITVFLADQIGRGARTGRIIDDNDFVAWII